MGSNIFGELWAFFIIKVPILIHYGNTAQHKLLLIWVRCHILSILLLIGEPFAEKIKLFVSTPHNKTVRGGVSACMSDRYNLRCCESVLADKLAALVAPKGDDWEDLAYYLLILSLSWLDLARLLSLLTVAILHKAELLVACGWLVVANWLH